MTSIKIKQKNCQTLFYCVKNCFNLVTSFCALDELKNFMLLSNHRFIVLYFFSKIFLAY